LGHTKKSLALLLFLCGLPTPGKTQGPLLQDYQRRAAFLYNVAKFVEWPAEAFVDATSPVVIGLVGNDPGSGALEWALVGKLAGKTAGGRPLAVRRWTASQEWERCHVLYVGASERERVEEILRHVQTTNVLTVSEITGFDQRGGIVHFALSGNQIQFEVNLLRAKHAGLTISSKLLKLARSVQE
jgi:hypothetical protein